MVLASSLCSSVMCILIPSVFNSKTSTIPNVQRPPLEFNKNDQPISTAASIATPVEVLLRQLAATSQKVNALPNGAALDNISAILQQRPSWFVGSSQPSIKIFGAGTESRFPPFLEFLVQRIQSFFSVYRYQDTSRPGPGSYIQDVEFIEPTKVTVNEATFPKEGGDGAIFSENAGATINDDYDDIFENGTGVISIGSEP